MEIRYLVDGRPLTARVVQQLIYRAYTAGMPGGLIDQRSIRGECAVVRVPGNGGVIAATLAGLGVHVSEPSEPFGSLTVSGSWDPLIPFTRMLLPSRDLETATFQALMAIEPPSPWVALTPDDLPLIVRFVDASDPGSAEWVDQWSETGPIRVVSARARFTKERRTRGEVEKHLPWINHLENQFELGRAGERSPVSDRMSESYLRAE
ncbi:MAG: hypothetical protein ACT6RD_05965 [Brevundimonas sp.]|uniref:hypothetical protein n=1 Tax=Brevundimonas sp. TaxID=1871086 RepID=UPI004033EB69